MEKGSHKSRINSFRKQERPNDQITKWSVVIAAFIGLIGVMVNAYFDHEKVQIPIRATQTAEARLTAVVFALPTSILFPTVTGTIPIRTLTPSLTNSPFPPSTSTAIPTSIKTPLSISTGANTLEPTPFILNGALSVGRLVFKDNFTNSASGWAIFSSEYESYYYQGGEYHINLKRIQRVDWSPAPYHESRNYAVQVDARQVSGGDACYGLIFRAHKYSDGNWSTYIFDICTYGYFRVRKWVQGQWAPLLVDDTFSSSIKQGSEMNRLLVVCRDSLFSFYINGTLVANANDSAFTTGQVGVKGGTLEQIPGDYAFDEFLIWTLP